MKKNKKITNIINLNDYKDVITYETIVKNIRIYDDIQEYCFVLDYEMIYEKPVIDAVDIGDVFSVFLIHPATLELIKQPIIPKSQMFTITFTKFLTRKIRNQEMNN